MLLECYHCNIVTQRYFSVTTLKKLIETIGANSITAVHRRHYRLCSIPTSEVGYAKHTLLSDPSTKFHCTCIWARLTINSQLTKTLILHTQHCSDVIFKSQNASDTKFSGPHWESSQRSPRPTSWWGGGSLPPPRAGPLPRTPPPLSALRASSVGPSGLALSIPAFYSVAPPMLLLLKTSVFTILFMWGRVGTETDLCGDGWGWIQVLAGVGGDGFKLHGDGWGWD